VDTIRAGLFSLKIALIRLLEADAPPLFFALAAMLGAWYGRFGPELLATVLNVSTINTYRAHILERMNMRTSTGLTPLRHPAGVGQVGGTRP
jgi:hypothetical protein